MVFRFVLHFLTNNEKLITKLSDSYPVRRTAQLVVLLFHRGKGLIEDNNLHHKLTPEQFKSLIQKFSQSMKQIQEQSKKFK